MLCSTKSSQAGGNQEVAGAGDRSVVPLCFFALAGEPAKLELRTGWCGPRSDYKPGSVPLRAVTICLRRRLPGASSDRYPRTEASSLKRPPIWSCSGRGLPGRPVTRPPVGSYPTFSPLPDCSSPEIVAAWRLFSVALSFGSPRLGVTQRPALWSPDFPPTLFTSPAVTRPPRPGLSLPSRLGFLNVLIDRLVSEPVGALVALPFDVTD
jgi:hypothetical protein